VELPFLQRLLGRFELIPILTCETADPDAVEALAASAAEPGTLVVVSSDLSHYLDAASARRVDTETAHEVEAGRRLRGVQACGAIGINALNVLAAKRRSRLHAIDVRSSADTAGPAERVVGYGAFRTVADVAAGAL
jgi:AmmeMemoRadiSam system protein B